MLFELKRKFDEEQDFTFKPSISKISEQVAKLRHEGNKDLISRLEEEAEMIQMKKQKNYHDKNEQEAKECSFQPRLNSTGNLMVN